MEETKELIELRRRKRRLLRIKASKKGEDIDERIRRDKDYDSVDSEDREENKANINHHWQNSLKQRKKDAVLKMQGGLRYAVEEETNFISSGNYHENKDFEFNYRIAPYQNF